MTLDVLRPRLCACGCGEYAATDQRRSRVSRFISGHNAKSDHPRGTLKHGMDGTPTYRSWRSWIARCLNPNTPNFRYWGGRGITISDRWLGDHGFENFLADLGERPDGLTLDRIDNEGNYEPGNVRWASWTQQANNRRAPGSYQTEQIRQKAR